MAQVSFAHFSTQDLRQLRGAKKDAEQNQKEFENIPTVEK